MERFLNLTIDTANMGGIHVSCRTDLQNQPRCEVTKMFIKNNPMAKVTT